MVTSQRLDNMALSGSVLASASGVALGLLIDGNVGMLLAGGLALCWAVALAPYLRLQSLLVLLPVLAVLPGGGWVALAGWSLATFVTLRVINHHVSAVDQNRLRELRAEMRDAEHERSLLHRHIQRYPTLLEACLEMSSVRELNQFAQVLCVHARELLPGIREVRVFLGTIAHQDCLASTNAQGQPCPREAGVDEQYVASEARPLIRHHGRLVHLRIPLRGDRRQGDSNEALRGVLEVVHESEDVGDRLALELLGALGRLGGLGLAAVDLVTQARTLALRDDLTGLYSQHEFLRRLDEQAAACRRHRTHMGLIMCDMDHLKRFNDRYGHPAGDAALRQVASTIKRELPEDTIICRYGGEEFAAIVIGQSLSRLEKMAQRVCAAIAEQDVPIDQNAARVTASLGVAILRDDEVPRAALQRADAACYRAKSSGRNRVEVDP
jgi:diguanylate cyclase (GGDEF)-like protein